MNATRRSSDRLFLCTVIELESTAANPFTLMHFTLLFLLRGSSQLETILDARNLVCEPIVQILNLPNKTKG